MIFKNAFVRIDFSLFSVSCSDDRLTTDGLPSDITDQRSARSFSVDKYNCQISFPLSSLSFFDLIVEYLPNM